DVELPPVPHGAGDAPHGEPELRLESRDLRAPVEVGSYLRQRADVAPAQIVLGQGEIDLRRPVQAGAVGPLDAVDGEHVTQLRDAERRERRRERDGADAVPDG